MTENPESKDPLPEVEKPRSQTRSVIKRVIGYSLASTFGAAAAAGYVEINYSIGQSNFFTQLASGSIFTKTVTESPTAKGPSDIEFGYANSINLRKRFISAGDAVTPQIPWEKREIPSILGIGEMTLPPIFHRPVQGGVRIKDDAGVVIYQFQSPRQTFPEFSNVPDLLVSSLALVEDQEILNPNNAENYNAAINWKRTVKAAAEQIGKKLHLVSGASGGSTIAIQNAKNDSWERGQTKSFHDKAEQMLTASTEMYMLGMNTQEAAKYQFLKYTNSVRFASHRDFGEVRGFPDAMAVWYGVDPDTLGRTLSGPKDANAAKVYRQVFSLIMAVKMPSKYLQHKAGYADLQARVDSYIPHLVRNNVISAEFGDMVLKTKLEYADLGKHPYAPEELPRDKSVDSLRLELLRKMGVPEKDGFYTLDRYDLNVETTLNGPVNAAVNAKLRSFNDPDTAIKEGLTGFRMLRPQTAPNVTWGITIYEKLPDGRNVVRVATDTFKGQMDMTKGGRMQYGSTSKLRMLETYLECMHEIYLKYANISPEDLKQARKDLHPKDNLSRWGIDYMLDTQRPKDAESFLRAALKREYRGNLGGFFTGRGMIYPGNFDPKENVRSYSVEAALWHSVNLSWFRITDDIEEYTKWGKLGLDPEILADTDHPDRKKFLEMFADSEGKQFLGRAWNEMKSKSQNEILTHLAQKTKNRTPSQLAVIFRSILPDASLEDMEKFIKANCTKCDSKKTLDAYYKMYAPGKFDLNDRGFLARPVHPLALAVGAELAKNPSLTWKEAVQRTANDRIAVYKWLIHSKKFPVQNKNIGIMMDELAWKDITARWQKFGYKFTLVPSLASSIGVSGDTTDALATFNAIMMNGGLSVNPIRFSKLQFAKGTPYEMTVTPAEEHPQRIIPEVIARLVIEASAGVVREGTGARFKDGIKLSDGTVLTVRGKTGTNDESETSGVRAGVFTGTIGDRFSFCIAGYILNATAQDKFTSGMAVQALKRISITGLLNPLFENKTPYKIKIIPQPVREPPPVMPPEPEHRDPETPVRVPAPEPS